MSVEHLEVPAEKLRIACDPDELGFKTTDDLEPLDGTIGQERAESALGLGLDIDAAGFNLFISGPPGWLKHGKDPGTPGSPEPLA